MTTFIVSLLLLVLGYFLYGAIVEKTFGANPSNKVPCNEFYDGIDFLPMPTWKVFLIQFLNIAGTGPIFGAIQGILFGPSAYLWIVLGCIFGGAVHDYLAGMISMRKRGSSLPEIVGDELGNIQRQMVRVFALVLMILVGAVFTTTPAGLISSMIGADTPVFGDTMVWIGIIFTYYLLATLLPIDKLIGRIYPVFGLALLIMAVGVGYGVFANEGQLPEITDAFQNWHPASQIPLFPGICITIACGAVSGFHATQSPMMARCMQNEKYGRPVFYGAMITEGLVAMIWAAAAIKFADSFDMSTIKFADSFNADITTPYGKLWAVMTNGGNTSANPAVIVNQICQSWLGTVGALLAVLGVIAAPITSGDTAMRCARLIAADFMHYKQDKIYKRLILSVPVFMLSGIVMFVDFSILWRYFAWFNQTLAMITLWAITYWLARNKKNYIFGLIPAIWMTLVSASYILVAPEGFQLNANVSYGLALAIVVALVAVFLKKKGKLKAEKD